MRVCPLFALAMIVAATPLAAQPRGLRYYDDLAETKVWDNLQEDIVPLATSDRYSQIRICAFRKHVRLFGGSLRFADGSEQALPQDIVIPASGCLRRLMLAGGQRPIESVRHAVLGRNFRADEGRRESLRPLAPQPRRRLFQYSSAASGSSGLAK